MKVTAFNKYTGEKIYEIELKECRIEHIADVSRNVRLGECWAYINEIPIRRECDNENDEFIAGVGAGIAAAAHVPGNGNGADPRRPRRKIVRISSLRRLVSGLHARVLLYILPAVRRPGGAIMIDAMGIERTSDRWQVRAIERDTGRLIVFPHVFDDPDEAAHQFARVCKSPHYRSVDIEVVLD